MSPARCARADLYQRPRVPFHARTKSLPSTTTDQIQVRVPVVFPSAWYGAMWKSSVAAILAMVSLGCGVGLVPELVRVGSPLRDAIAAVPVKDPPPGFAVALCAKRRTLERRTMAAFWELAEARAVAALPAVKRGRKKR